MQKIPELNALQRAQIAEVLKLWAAAHPHPENAVLATPLGENISPLDLARAAAEPDSDRGQWLYGFWAKALYFENEFESQESRKTLDDMLDVFRREAQLWRSQKKPGPQP